MTKAKHMADENFHPLLLAREVAEMLDVSVRTVENWRQTGGGPAYCKLGQLVRYRMDDVTAFMDGRKSAGKSSGQ